MHLGSENPLSHIMQQNYEEAMEKIGGLTDKERK
jgi:hypothetical protein